MEERKLELTTSQLYREEDYLEEGYSKAEMEASHLIRNRLRQYREVKEPFSVSPFFEYFDSFILGLQLDTFYESASECIDGSVYFIDDWAYIQNNSTYRDVWYDPIVNFTGIISGNASEIVNNCYTFVNSIYTVTETNVGAFDSVADYFLGFLFN
jgi:hypothetical protein